MQETYFHVAPMTLDVGSVILPGNWGRIVENYQFNNSMYVYFREKIFEEVRINEFANKPSRMESVFLSESLEESKYFKQKVSQFSNQFSIVYEVEILEEEKEIHRGDWEGIDSADNEKTADEQIKENALVYWSGNNINHAEIVTESKIKIIRQVQ